VTESYHGTPMIFGYRSPAHGRNGWLPWLLVALAGLEAMRLLATHSVSARTIFSATLFTLFAVEFVLLMWLRRVLVTEIRVHAQGLHGTTRTESYRVDLVSNPAVAVIKRHRFHRLVFRDGSWFRVAIQSRDWSDFATALAAAQGTPIDQSAVGRIFTSSAWFRKVSAGYFVEA